MILLLALWTPPADACTCAESCTLDVVIADVLSPEARPLAFMGSTSGATATFNGDELPTESVRMGTQTATHIGPPDGGWPVEDGLTVQVSTDCGTDTTLVFDVVADDDWEAPQGGLIQTQPQTRTIESNNHSCGDTDLIDTNISLAHDPGYESDFGTAAYIEVGLSSDTEWLDEPSGTPEFTVLLRQAAGSDEATYTFGVEACSTLTPGLDADTVYYGRSRAVDLSGNWRRWSDAVEFSPDGQLNCDGCAASGSSGSAGAGWLALMVGVVGAARRRV